MTIKNKILHSTYNPKSISLSNKGSLLNIMSVFSALLVLIQCSCKAQIHSVSLSVDMNQISNVNEVSVLGNLAPLSWDKAYKMTDADGDGVYHATLRIRNPKKVLRFKFKVNDEEELQGSDNRVLGMKETSISEHFIFNEYNIYDQSEIDSITFSFSEIEEDVNIYKTVLEYIHPSIYTFRDSVSLQKDFQLLEEDLKSNPNLTHAYGAISKLAAKVKCSHTFTNPWNQGYRVDKALMYQNDKLPFTFHRIGTRLFIDKNASNNKQVKKGLEILSINDTPVKSILTQLAKYVTSDGNNNEKKYERLSLTGREKFSMFDIFYPIEYGSTDAFKIQLKAIDHEDIIETEVQATSKTNRTRILTQRYGSLESSLKDGWKFEFIDDITAKLSIRSFAVQRKGFDWKKFLNNHRHPRK